MRCEQVAEQLSATVDGSVVLDVVARRHVEHCLRCQAEVVQYRKLLRALHSLRTEVLVPAPGLVSEVLVALADAGERSARRGMLSGRRAAYLGGVAAAAGAVGGAIVLASRSRRHLAS